MVSVSAGRGFRRSPGACLFELRSTHDVDQGVGVSCRTAKPKCVGHNTFAVVQGVLIINPSFVSHPSRSCDHDHTANTYNTYEYIQKQNQIYSYMSKEHIDNHILVFYLTDTDYLRTSYNFTWLSETENRKLLADVLV